MEPKDVIQELNRQFGKGSVVRLSDKPQYNYGENVISTGSLGLDMAIGVGGFPRGRIVEIQGNAQGGKTTLALHAVAEAQKLGLNVLYVDAEHCLDVFYASEIGVDIGSMYINQPEYGEQGLSIVDTAISSKAFGLIVVDSVAALVPKRELEGDVGDSHVGLQARMMSQVCRKIGGSTRTTNTLVIFINQFRANIATTGFGGPTKIAAGGKALDYASSLILEVSKIQSLKEGDEHSGSKTSVSIKKNKLAPPYRSAVFSIIFGRGIDKIGEIVDLAEVYGLIIKTGSWYKLPDKTSIGQGKNGAIKYLTDNPKFAESLRAEIISIGSSKFHSVDTIDAGTDDSKEVVI